jgi:hypothetical protein
MIDEETYAAMADLSLEARLDAHLERTYNAPPTDAEIDAMLLFVETQHGCWPTPDQLWMWEEDTASWCDID